MAELLQLAPRPDVPEADRAIQPAGDEAASVPRECDAVNLIGVPQQSAAMAGGPIRDLSTGPDRERPDQGKRQAE